MRKSVITAIVLAFLLLAAGFIGFYLKPSFLVKKSPVDFVNPFICTQGDHGHWLPAALVPFGLVELCPDTYPGSLTADGDLAHSGYDFSDSQIRGFSHFHRGSSGGGSIHDRAGLISLVPFSDAPDTGFYKNPVLDIDKASEKAKAGFYSVNLVREGIQVELTATAHVGMHRYSFKKGQEVRTFLNSGKRNQKIKCILTANKEIEGKVGNRYFVLQFNYPVRNVLVWNGKGLKLGCETGDENGEGLVCEFGDLQGSPLLVKAGFSLNGTEAARENLETECPHWNFEQVKEGAHNQWNDILSRIKVEGKDEYKTIFYTALYHTCFLPDAISDVSGAYPGLDKQMHTPTGYKYYDNYAFWDSFRTKYPLYSLWIPGVYADITESLRDIYQQADNCLPFPDWNHPPHGACFTYKGKDGYSNYSTCRHEHMVMVMVDAWAKGLYRSDIKLLYPFLKREVMIQMPERYDPIGYIPARPDQTGEYSWDNWCVAQVAKAIGNQADYEYLMNRSRYWRNTWDREISYFRARAADGSWLDFPDDPTLNREKYTYEGSKWQYRWNVVHDVPSLIEEMGGKDQFVAELSYFFDNDLYTAGNQIDLHAPFLFNMGASPWLTQKWVRKILTEPIVQKYGTHEFFPTPIFDRIYKTTPDGFLEEMDDDYGCMSAWYAMSAMGLYQICPGNPVYQITAPIFDKITVQLDPSVYPGKKFVIRAKNLDSRNFYIQSATLNGKPFNQSWITHDDIIRGGELVFIMGSSPNQKWGIGDGELNKSE